MFIDRGIKQVVGSKVDSYNAPKYWNICGVDVCFKPVTGGVPESEWRDVLDEWLPKLDELGLIDGLRKIIIAKDSPPGDLVGRYINNEIHLNNDIDLQMKYTPIFELTSQYVLTHEVIHHAHISQNGFPTCCDEAPRLQEKLRREVSYYSGENVKEAVAEIGAGTIHGHDIPRWAYDYYDELDGPQAIYDH